MSGKEPLKKELDAVKMELQREVNDLKRELWSTKNELNEAKRENEILKRSQTCAVDNSRKKKCVSYEESPTRHESCIIMVGSLINNKYYGRDVIKINLNRANEVSTIGQLPFIVKGESASAVYGNSLFVTGLGDNYDKIWKFDARSSKWEYCNTMIQGRTGHNVAFVDHVLYICGGWTPNGETGLDGVEAYDTIDDKHATVGKLVHGVQHCGNCVPFNSSLYIFGGEDECDKAVDYVQVYCTKSNSCTLLSKRMPVAERLYCAVLCENKALLFGFSNFLIYNFDTGTWQMRDQFDIIPHFSGITLHDGKLFVFGGCEYNNDSDGQVHCTFRDDVRYVPVANMLSGESIEWSHHSKLPNPSQVFALGKLQFQLK